ncbi:MAG TPA: hypothetical protein VFX14_17105 [Methylomirabilota bacterium]|nr:hypothetical protein [Methylomirabilota bacterium]
MTPTSPDSRSLSNPDRNIGRLARRLCIVARNHPLLFGYLSTLFRDRPIGSEQIELVIDRRHPESPRPPDVERRRPSEVDEELRRRGFAFVVEPGETFRPRDAARIEHTVELLAGMEERSWPFRRRRRRPVIERIWGQRAGRTLAILGGVALVVAFASSEFRMNDLRDSDLIGWPLRSLSRVASSTAPADKPQADAPAPVVTPPAPPAPVPAAPPAPTTTAPSAPAPVAIAPPAPPAPVPPAPVAAAPPAPAPPAPIAAAPPAPAKQTPVAAAPPAPPSAARLVPHGPAPAPAAPAQAVSPATPPAPPKATAPAPKAMAAAEAPAVSSRNPGAAPREAASRAALPERPRALASSSSAAPMGRTSAREPAAPGSGREPAGAVATTAPAPVSGDLRIELSRKPTSATGGGVVFLVRVTDLAGQPLSDAEVSMLAGRRPGGALFETRLYPAESPGTFRSGVIHPSTLPPDLTVMAVAGNRHVETLVAR